MKEIIFVVIIVLSAGITQAESLSEINTLEYTTTGNVYENTWVTTEQIKNVIVKPDYIEITYQQRSPWVYPEGGSPPDAVWKERYVVKDGKIVFEKKIEGRHIPTKIIDEHFEWPEVEK